MDIGNLLKAFIIILGVVLLMKAVFSLAKKKNDRTILSGLGYFVLPDDHSRITFTAISAGSLCE